VKRVIVALLLFTAGPLDEISAARSAYDSLPADRQHTTLYVSLLGTTAKAKADVELAFDLILNGVDASAASRST
jgi:hypothetical protein